MNVYSDIQPVLDAIEIPDPKSRYRFEDIYLHEVKGLNGEDVLVAFGLIPLERMIKAVYGYEMATEIGEAVHYDPTLGNSIRAVLEHLAYRRVFYTSVDGGFTLDWTTGLIPVTVWTL